MLAETLPSSVAVAARKRASRGRAGRDARDEDDVVGRMRVLVSDEDGDLHRDVVTQLGDLRQQSALDAQLVLALTVSKLLPSGRRHTSRPRGVSRGARMTCHAQFRTDPVRERVWVVRRRVALGLST
jgi:hypothetical protein